MNTSNRSTDRSSAEGAKSTDWCCTEPEAVDESRIAEDTGLLSALGNDTRYELVRRIAASDDGVCVCDLEAAVGVSQSAVSQALSRLYAAELVTRRKEGAWRYYETTGAADAVLETLDAIVETRND